MTTELPTDVRERRCVQRVVMPPALNPEILLKECVPKGDGTWWPTHALEVTQNDAGERPGPQ